MLVIPSLRRRRGTSHKHVDHTLVWTRSYEAMTAIHSLDPQNESATK